MEFDAFTDALDYPLYVVTAAAGDRYSGCLVGFASQCSIDPPQFAVWLSKANHTHGVASDASHLGVHVLDRHNRDLAALFGSLTGDDVDKFEHVAWHRDGTGVPVLTDVRTWFVGRIVSRFDGGDHTGFVLAPVDVSDPVPAPSPLLSFSDVQGLPPGHPA
ncbi:flavin reductase family protein [Streptomyces sp. NPDC019396]|uniref:flavin reductase family protein n=1 Tax=Streptomyces sp. NPDC019396 TaxID=3154687 RepID=UPI0033F4C66A